MVERNNNSSAPKGLPAPQLFARGDGQTQEEERIVDPDRLVEQLNMEL